MTSALAPASDEPDGDGVGAVAAEDRQRHGADLGDGRERGGRLGHHRHEHADGVARADAALEQRAASASTSRRSSAYVSVRVSPFSPSQTIAVVRSGALGVSIDAVVGEVESCLRRTTWRTESRASYRAPAVRLEPLEPEEPHDRVPEPRGLSDRALAQLTRSRDAHVRHEAPQVRPGDVPGCHTARLSEAMLFEDLRRPLPPLGAVHAKGHEV